MPSDHPFPAVSATQRRTFHPLKARKLDDVTKRHHKHIEERINTASFNLTGSKLCSKKTLKESFRNAWHRGRPKIGWNIDIIAFDITEIRECLNFDLTGRYVDMRLDRGNCGLGNDSISVNIHRPSRILVPVKVLHFSQGGSNTFLTQA